MNKRATNWHWKAKLQQNNTDVKYSLPQEAQYDALYSGQARAPFSWSRPTNQVGHAGTCCARIPRSVRPSMSVALEASIAEKEIRKIRQIKRRQTHPVDFMKPIHVQLPNETRELQLERSARGQNISGKKGKAFLYSPTKIKLTLLCLKWDPKMLRLNSPTFETTNDVPSSVQAMNCADFGSLIILCQEKDRK